VDPLIVVEQAVAQGTFPRPLAARVRRKMGTLSAAVERVERASGVPYPPYYVEPVLPYSTTGAEYGQMGVLFARVIPTTANGGLAILVQFSAALLIFGTKGAVEAVAAHEFTHYVDLVRRLSKGSLTSDEGSSTLFEAAYADVEKTVPPKLVFSETSLVALVNRKFKDVLVDPKLTRLVDDKWIAKNLPMRMVPPEENRVRVGVETIVKTKFEPSLLRKIAQIEEKMNH
jgi:hypothetical protein